MTMLHLVWLLLIFLVRVRAFSLQSQRPTFVGRDATSSTSTTTTTTTTLEWYPHRLQDVVPTVHRWYVRSIVTYTDEMARFALSHYRTLVTNSTELDPFHLVQQLCSIESQNNNNGGYWIDATSDNDNNHTTTSVVSQALAMLQPKPGDIHIVQNEPYWLVLQILHTWMPLRLLVEEDLPTSSHPHHHPRIGSYGGTTVIRAPTKRKQSRQERHSSHWTTYRIQTTGCQMNVADSERMEGILQGKMGLVRASNDDMDDVAQILIFNTCSIRDRAEQKLYQAVRPYSKKNNKGKTKRALIVTGCVAQQESENLIRRMPELDAVVGPQYIQYLDQILEQVALGHQVVATAPMLIQENNDWTTKPLRGHSVRAWVNVIYGCNEHCTYCVVPATRGMEQSRTMEAILAECLDLAANGYKEVTLLGQNIDAYGRDMVPKRTFCELLEFLNARLPDRMRIRYVTSHPRYFGNRVIDAVANLDKVCECFHMPFQAGDDEVLGRMRRGYTYESYMTIIRRIREKAPDASISADIIVGFPGESEAAFQKTLQLMEEVKFDNVNSFVYSPRPNTEAALWDDQVPDDIKSERLQRVQQLAAVHGLERSRRYVGRTEEILVEDANPRDPNQVMGRTRQGRQVYFDGDLEKLRGEFVQVRITEARTWSLMGELVG